jgi:integrase
LYLNPPDKAVVVCIDEKSRSGVGPDRADPADAARAAGESHLRAPHHRLSVPGVSSAVTRPAARAGLGHVTARRLRHTAATAMVAAGAALPQVGQVLRHRRLLSTSIYAKVD